MVRYILFAGWVMLACSCNNQRGVTAADQATETAAIKQMFTDCNDDIRTHGLLAEFKYLDSSDQFFWAPPGFSLAMGYDTIAKIMRSNASVIKEVDNNWDSLVIHVISPETAVYTGIVRTSITGTGGNTFKYTMLETGTLIKRTDGWKFLCGQTARLAPPM